MNNRKPILGITMGDPAGCGPELTVKALLRPEIAECCRAVVVADARAIEDAARILGADNLVIRRIDNVAQAQYKFGTIEVLHTDLIDMKYFAYGKISAMCGEAAFQCVKRVIRLALEGEVDATVTNAINKEAINLAGYNYAGHTEIYAEMTGTKNYAMMLVHDNLRVVHVSTHLSLREACERVTKERVGHAIRLAHDACVRLNIAKPRIGVAGLNPHAGENGMFGREEICEIVPAVEEAKAAGLTVDGPLPADSLFSKALGGWYDVVVAMYHDQGHIPLKVVGFRYNQKDGRWDSVSGVNITLGLPIIRTSVDHGTAFGHAGQGIQNEISLVNAIEAAAQMAMRVRN